MKDSLLDGVDNDIPPPSPQATGRTARNVPHERS